MTDLVEETLQQGNDAIDRNMDDYVPKEKLDDIIKRNRAAAADKARKEAEAQHRAEIEALRAQQGTMGGMQQVDEEQLFNKLQKRFLAEQQKAQFSQQVDSAYDKFLRSMPKGKEHYEDFDQVMRDFVPEEFPELVFLVSQSTEDPSHIMREMLTNPTKLSAINDIAKSSPRLAVRYIKEMEDSIKQNMQAKNQPVAPQPLNQIRSSPMAGTANNNPSIQELRKAPQLRG